MEIRNTMNANPIKLSIIIAHYAPRQSGPCDGVLQRTLKQISGQLDADQCEIIIADDGSPAHRDIMKRVQGTPVADGRLLYTLKDTALQNWCAEQGIENTRLSGWLYLPKSDPPAMSKARLWNLAAEQAKARFLLFLDDDNIFYGKQNIRHLLTLSADYRVVFGQVADRSGRFRSYESERVQGTTFMLHADILRQIGGFGEWTEATSSGIDSDLWWKLYREYETNRSFRACYTSRVQTQDTCSKRWAAWTGWFRRRAVITAFKREHGCRNYRKSKFNPSRVKANWMENQTETESPLRLNKNRKEQ